MSQSREGDRFAGALGASRVVPLQGVAADGPLGLLWLRAAVARDVRPGPSGGAGNEPSTAARAVPSAISSVAAERFRCAEPARWREIEHLTAELRDRPLADAMDLAERLVEHALLPLPEPAGVQGHGRKDPSSHRAAPAVLLDSFYEGLDSPADCLESEEAA